MILLLFSLPLLGTILSGIFGRYLGINLTKWLCIILLILTNIIAYYIYLIILSIDNIIYTINIGKWIDIDYLTTDYSLSIDMLNITMIIVILTISLLVNIYSYNYMKDDPHQQRFYSYLCLFTTFMILLVLGDNYLIAFIGWEYIGLASFLLIGYWYTSISVVKSSLSALLMNKIGDWLFIITLILIINYYGTFNYTLIYSISHIINNDINNIIILLLFIACSVKSAQYGLHSWLIWAMAGPTPVSVLLHAATLVIAGIYILLRSTPILEYTPTILILILWVGGLTTFIAGLIAIYSNDIKRIIALSTMSQLGMMVIAIGISNYNLALFHLLCHSIYKALLFMGAGSIIHTISNENQDIRYMGINIKYMPITYISILIACLSLMAIPYLTGYYSKDIIIESMLGNYTITAYIIYWLSLLSAILTSIYSYKILYNVFYSNPNTNKYYYKYIKESSYYMLIPMIILSFSAIYIGYILHIRYIGIGNNISGIFIYPNNLCIIDTEFSLNPIFKLLPLIMILICSTLTIYLYEYNNKYIYNKVKYNIYVLFNGRLLYDQLFNNLILRKLLKISGIINNNIENGLIYNIGPYGIWRIFNNITILISKLTTNILYNYAIYTLYTIIFISITILFIIYPISINNISLYYISINNIIIYIIIIMITIIFISIY